MLAREIAHLTGLRLLHIARRGLARHVRVEVAVGGGAVAVGAHGEGVDVIDCAHLSTREEQNVDMRLTEWTTLSRQARDADVEVDAIARGIGARNDRPAHSVVFGEDGDVLHALRIVRGDRSTASESCRK